MTTRTMYDGTYSGWQSLQSTVPTPVMFAYGITGWTPAQVATLPAATIKIAIDTDGTHASTTSVIDVEGAFVTSAAVIAAWISAVNSLPGGYSANRPTVYINSKGFYYLLASHDVISPLKNTYNLLPGRDYDIWIADRTGSVPSGPMYTLGVPSVAWQYKSYAQTGHQYDVNIVFDATWHPGAAGPGPGGSGFPLASAPAVPVFPAGYAPLPADFTTWITSTLGFAAQGVVFRAEQRTQQGTGSGGAFTTMVYDTILEDPAGPSGTTGFGWNSATNRWIPPYTGWYEVTIGTNVIATAGSPTIEAAVNLTGVTYELSETPTYSANVGGSFGSALVFCAGGSDYIGAYIMSSATTTTDCTTAGRYPFIEITFEST